MNTRQLHLLDYLMRQPDYFTAQQLANQFGVSPKTIYHDIDVLNAYLQEHAIQITKLPRRGIRLKLDVSLQPSLYNAMVKMQQDSQIESFSPEYREQALIRHLFLLPQPFNLLDFADQVFVTEQSVRRDMDNLMPLLMQHQLRLNRQPHWKIEGSETNKRQFLRRYLSELMLVDTDDIDTLTHFFNPHAISQCQHAVSRLSEKYHCEFANNFKLLILLDCLIIQRRWQLHHALVQRSTDLVGELQHLEVYFLAGELLESILDLPLQDIPSYEIEALAYTLLASGFKVGSITYTQSLTELVQSLTQRVTDLVNIDITQDSHLQRMLTQHLEAMFFRLRQNLHIQNPMLEEIKRQYAPLFHFVWFAMQDIERHYQVTISDEELAFIVIHFQIAIEKIRRPLAIVVVCQAGIASSELVVHKIQRFIHQGDYLRKMTLSELTDEADVHADLIITTVNLPFKPTTLPVVRVSPIITQSELLRLQRCYDELNSSNQAMLRASLQHSDANLAFLEALLSVAKTQLVIKNQTDCLNHLINACHPANRQFEAFGQAIHERESIGSTSIYTGVALPHCDPQYVQRSELLITTLKQPIQWGNNHIRMVILIAIKEADLTLFKNSLIALYSIVENKELIENLCHITDPHHLKEQLLKEVSNRVR